MTYFDQIDPINDIFDQSYVNKPDLHNVSKFLEENCFDHFPQILTYDVILGHFWGQNDPIVTILIKNDLF